MGNVQDDTAPSVKTVGTLMGMLGITVGFIPSYFIANTNMEVLKHEIESVQRQIQAGMDDRYRGADAERDHRLIAQRDSSMREAIQTNAAHIKELEQLLRDHASDRDTHKQ